MRDDLDKQRGRTSSRFLGVFFALCIVTAIGVLSWLALAAYQAREAPGIPAGTGNSRSFVTDMEPVEMHLWGLGGGTRLSVPAAFMQWSSDRRGEADWRVAMMVVYPEMTPYAHLNKEERDRLWTAEFEHDQLRYSMLMHVSGSRPGVTELLLQHEIDRKYTAALGEKDGFTLYRQKIADLYYDYLVPTDTSETGLRYFKCAGLTEAELPRAETLRRCFGHLQYNDRLSADYLIPRSELKQWRDVDARVLQLVKTFVVDCFDGPKLKPGERPNQTHPCLDHTGSD